MVVYLEPTPWGWIESSADERLPARVVSSVESVAACLKARMVGSGAPPKEVLDVYGRSEGMTRQPSLVGSAGDSRRHAASRTS